MYFLSVSLCIREFTEENHKNQALPLLPCQNCKYRRSLPPPPTSILSRPLRIRRWEVRLSESSSWGSSADRILCPDRGPAAAGDKDSSERLLSSCVRQTADSHTTPTGCCSSGCTKPSIPHSLSWEWLFVWSWARWKHKGIAVVVPKVWFLLLTCPLLREILLTQPVLCQHLQSHSSETALRYHGAENGKSFSVTPMFPPWEFKKQAKYNKETSTVMFNWNTVMIESKFALGEEQAQHQSLSVAFSNSIKQVYSRTNWPSPGFLSVCFITSGISLQINKRTTKMDMV